MHRSGYSQVPTYPLQDLQALEDPPEDNVLHVTLRGRGQCEEELRGVAVLTAVGHGEDARGVVLELEPVLLIIEFPVKNRITPTPIT